MKQIVIILSFCISLGAIAQHNTNFCSQHKETHKALNADPILKAKWEQEQAEKQQAFETYQASKTERTTEDPCTYDYVISVVFHVLHENGTENISDAQIFDEMKNLNANFNSRNPDTIQIVDDFKALAGRGRIQFRLAQKDPNGNPTTGIVRYETSETNNAGESIKPSRNWDRSRYLNVYSVKSIGSGAAGYTYLPSNFFPSASNDAILILHTYIGSIGTGNYNRSKALTHEIGHWLDLPHPWGGTNDPGVTANCNDDDGVADTPNTVGYTSCDLDGTSCGSLDNVQNFMDYSYCSVMFTQGQIDRMTLALQSSTASRNNLWTAATLASTGVDQLTASNFYTDYQIVCSGNYVNYTDLSTYGATSWNWAFAGGSPSSASESCVEVQYHTPGVYDVDLSVSLGSQAQGISKTNHIFVTDRVGANYPYSQDFESITQIPSSNFYVENPDEALATTWQLSTNAGYQSSNSAVMSNIFNTDGEKEGLVSETIDLSQLTSASFSFDYAYASKSGANDIIRVYFSGDCGLNWSLGWLTVGNSIATAPEQNTSFTPASDAEWDSKTISSIPSSLLNEGFMYKFELESDEGNNLYIDNINITGTYKDYPVLEFPVNEQGGLPNNTLINWKSVELADTYEYEIDNTDLFNSSNLISGSTTYLGVNPDDVDTEYQTSGLTNGETYYWRVRAVTNGSASAWSDVWQFTVSINGVGFEEWQNHEAVGLQVIPNPINGNGWINFNVTNDHQTSVTIYDMIGKQVEILDNSFKTKGNYSVPFNSSNYAKGMYLVRVKQGSNLNSTKLLVR